MKRIEAIAEGLQVRLTTDQSSGSVYDQVNGRIYQGSAPQNETPPFLVWNLVPGGPVTSFNHSHLAVEAQIDLWASRNSFMSVAGQIADDLFALLHRQALSIEGFRGGYSECLDQGRRMVMDDMYRIRSRWRIRATQQ